MLGQYLQLHSLAQAAAARMSERVSLCTYPLLYCNAGVLVGYALDGRVAGQRHKQTFYFDAQWQPLTAAPTGGQPCCQERQAC
jgi:hypothetical protein